MTLAQLATGKALPQNSLVQANAAMLLIVLLPDKRLIFTKPVSEVPWPALSA